MIKLIKNEIKKIGIIKLIIPLIILIIAIILIKKYTNDFILNIYTLIEFLQILIVILFSSIMSNEYNNGTFKIYLTKPISRKKILLSKYLIEIIYSIILIVTIIVSISLINKINIEIIKNILILSSPLLLISAIVLLFSTLKFSNSLTVGILSILVIFSQTITGILMNKLKMIEYTFIPYLDLNYIINDNYLLINSEYNMNITLIKSICIIIFYSIIIYFITELVFIKKDIKN